MSKVYKVATKHLMPLLKPVQPSFTDNVVVDQLRPKEARIQQAPWTPIDQRFYQDASCDEEDLPKLAGTDANQVVHFKLDTKQELEWDDDDEQLQLGHSPHTEKDPLQVLLKPRQLYQLPDLNCLRPNFPSGVRS